MRDKNDPSAYASYSTFYIGGSITNYTLHASVYIYIYIYSVTDGDSFTTIYGGLYIIVL